MRDSVAAAWRCTVCGYVHRGSAPPDFCPVCGASAAEFEPFREAPPAPAAAAGRWRCVNCNYVPAGAAAPDRCPVCGAGRDRFEGMPGDQAAPPGLAFEGHAVIVGAGIAGVSAAEALRGAAPAARITLVSRETRLPYYRLNLTRYLAGEIAGDAITIHPADWYRRQRIEMTALDDAAGLDPARGRLTLGGGTELTFDRLILAMGAHPFVPPIPGVELDGVKTLRAAEDADDILARATAGARCVCIGGGVLGIETAGALARRGADVTLLESHAWLMPRQLNRAAGRLVRRHVESLGIRLREEARTRELAGAGGRVARVVLEDGAEVPAELVVLATGVRPNTFLARKAGLEVNRGIVVDNRLCTSHPAIYAAGDVAEHNGVLYGLWGASQFQGAIAGLNAAGGDAHFGGLPRSNALKVLGLDMLSIGQFEPEDGSYTVVGDEQDGRLRHFVFRDGRLVGAILLGAGSLGAAVKRAIEGNADFSQALAGAVTAAGLAELLAAGGT